MNPLQRDLLGYVFAAGGGVLLLAWCIPTYSPEYPGYGVPADLVPNVAAGFMLLLALLGLGRTLVLLYQSRRQAPATSHNDTAASGDAVPQTHISWGHLARFFLPCAVLMPAIAWVGFIPACMLFLLLIQWFCGQRKILTLAVVAVIPVLVLYALMRFALGVPLP